MRVLSELFLNRILTDTVTLKKKSGGEYVIKCKIGVIEFTEQLVMSGYFEKGALRVSFKPKYVIDNQVIEVEEGDTIFWNNKKYLVERVFSLIYRDEIVIKEALCSEY